MPTYSVAAAKGSLPRLLDRALEGEEVIITRHGKAIAELRPVTSDRRKASPASYAWLKAQRQARAGVGVTSVDLLNQLYEEPKA
jgi:antitoxin (DNA-binding transcriptional repressor) of toxin-antitoxin stability system